MGSTSVKLLRSILLSWLAIPSLAQQPLQVMDWKTDVTVNTFLSERMHRQYDQRRIQFALAVKNKAAASKYVDTLRKKTRALIADAPAVKGVVTIMGTISNPGYKIERLQFAGFSGRVTANLYTPTGRGPFPAILFLCGHEDLAKATASYQKTAQLLVQNGFVVLIVDPISQAERHQFLDSTGKPLTRGGTTEHTLINQAAALFGNSTAAYEVWDNQEALNMLMAMPGVDVARIGCMGNSGGAIQAIYLTAIDKRIKAVSVSSYFSSRERTFDLTGAADGCAHVPGEGAAMLEMNDLLMAAAPLPVQITAGAYDFIDFEGAKSAFNEMQQLYRALGKQEALDFFSWEDGHGLSRPKQVATVKWFRKWLNPGEFIETKESSVLPAAQLQVNTTGQVNAFIESSGIGAWHQALFEQTKVARAGFDKLATSGKRASIRRVLNIPLPGDVSADTVGTESVQRFVFHKIIIRSATSAPLPLLILDAVGSHRADMVILNDEGMRATTSHLRWLDSLSSSGFRVILADLSGFGETADKPTLNDPKFYNREYRNAVLAIHTGISMTAQRTLDILNIVSFLKVKKAVKVHVVASGALTVPALHAAALEPSIDTLKLINAVRSFRDILNDPLKKDWYSIVIPNVLLHYDLPQLAAMVKMSYAQTLADP